MQARDLVAPATGKSSTRRIGIGLTAKGRAAAESAIVGHGGNIHRYFFETLTPEQAAVLHSWSRQTVDRVTAETADG